MYQYLLSVAEKIIDASVPQSISSKYYELKKSLMAKYPCSMQKQNSNHKQSLYEIPTLKLNQPRSNIWRGSEMQEERFEFKKFSSHATSKLPSPIVYSNQNDSHSLSQIKQESQAIYVEKQELVKDNKWLIQQLDRFIRQNTILKKMVEKKI